MSANKILPFKFWCQKVLPLIYDDSLSYLEVLCKVTAKLNELIESDNSQSDAIEELQIAVQELIEQEAQVKEDILELKGRMTTAENDIIGLSGRMTTAENDILIINSSIEGIALSVDAIRTKLFTLTDNFASEYDNNYYYNAGQYCIYNERLYRCVEDIPNPSGEFDPSKWERTKASVEFVRLWDECSNIRLALDALVVNFMGNLALPFFNYEGETVTYTEGDLVTDYQWLYKCIQGYSFDEVVPTPANDRIHWQQTTIAQNLSSGGGGGGGSDIPDWDSERSYERFDCVKYNNHTYMAYDSTPVGTLPTDTDYWYLTSSLNYFSSALNTELGYSGLYYGQGAIEGQIFGYWDTLVGGDERVAIQRATQSFASGATEYFTRSDIVEELNTTNDVVYGYGCSTYDDTKIYNAGDLIVYGRVVMVCNSNNVTGAYDHTKWDNTNIFEELASVKNTLINLNLYNGNVVDRYNTRVTEVI